MEKHGKASEKHMKATATIPRRKHIKSKDWKIALTYQRLLHDPEGVFVLRDTL